jgi:hypothetical protein
MNATELKADVDRRNAATSQAEVDQFMTQKPTEWYGYLDSSEACLTTFTGQVIANVTYRSIPFRALNGPKIRQFQFVGINGLTYYGKGQGAGMSIRIFAKK